MKITILALYDRISVYHTLKPFLQCRGKSALSALGHDFTFTDSPAFCMKKDTARVLIMVRLFLKPPVVDYVLMEKLRSKYERIVFFNGYPGGGIHHHRLLPFVDLYYNKSLLKNRRLYTTWLYGNELFADYYHKHYGVNDDPDQTVGPITDAGFLDRLRLSWNVGIGDFPRTRFKQRVGVFLARLIGIGWSRPFAGRSNPPMKRNTGRYTVHARFGYQSQATITHQRRIIQEKIADHPAFLTGKVAQSQYNHEIQNSRIVLSPFGWGELCFRDYEAVQSGALLVKPDMSHLETWPDIFKAGETYIPVAWDGSDVVEKCEYYLGHDNERKRIVENAYHVYRAQTDQLCARFQEALGEIVG